jgi:hypothetical protein
MFSEYCTTQTDVSQEVFAFISWQISAFVNDMSRQGRPSARAGTVKGRRGTPGAGSETAGTDQKALSKTAKISNLDVPSADAIRRREWVQTEEPARPSCVCGSLARLTMQHQNPISRKI